jgi:hypothetical protein
VTNSTLTPSIVVFEPKSFSIDLDGTGEFRPLNPEIHLELSATSLRLEPHQSARVFYKASADNVPAWLCIYASFSSVKKVEGVNLRILLPHTIYLYQKAPLGIHNIEVESVRYDVATHRVLCELTNTSTMAGRAQSVEVTGRHSSASAGGFPLLPHQKRILSVEWTAAQPPQSIDIEFEHFSLKRAVEE